MNASSMNKKICVITGTRAEYGLLYWTMRKIDEDSDLTLQIIATGSHLSPEFGYTYKQIEKDRFLINKKIEILLSSDSEIGVCKSMGLALISFAEAFSELIPDLIIVLGDRFEVHAAVSAAMICRIPVAHCHGGEITEGAIDESIRHSITKMSHFHFTSTDEYRKRVIQMGEQPENVFNVGALGVENINKLSLLNKKEFEKSIDRKLLSKNVLVTYHPVTLEHHSAQQQTAELLKALDKLENTLIIFTKANADTEGRVINQMIDQYVSLNSDKAIAFDSLGQLRYLSAMQFMNAVIGNSSSGIIEVPYFNIPTINIGNRQKGRIRAQSVIDCEANFSSIETALNLAFSENFIQQIKDQNNPYGFGNSSELILKEIKKTDPSIIKKKFFDINTSL